MLARQCNISFHHLFCVSGLSKNCSIQKSSNNIISWRRKFNELVECFCRIAYVRPNKTEHRSTLNGYLIQRNLHVDHAFVYGWRTFDHNEYESELIFHLELQKKMSEISQPLHANILLMTQFSLCVNTLQCKQRNIYRYHKFRSILCKDLS